MADSSSLALKERAGPLSRHIPGNGPALWTLPRSEEPQESHRHKQDKACDLPGHLGLWTRELSMAQLILIIEAKTFQEMYLSLSPMEGQRLSILRSWEGAGSGVRENASGKLSPGRGASHTALAVPADQTLGKEFGQVQPCLSGTARGRGAAGDVRATSRSPGAHKG